MSHLLPILLDISKVNILIVGGGKVAARKAIILQQFTNSIKIIGKTINSKIKDTGLKYIEKKYDHSDLDKINLVFACTNDPKVNREIKAYCNKKKILINVTDNPLLSDFYSPALIIYENMTIAVNSKQQNVKKAIKYRNEIKNLFNTKILTNTDFYTNDSLTKHQSENKMQKQIFLPLSLNLKNKKILIIGSKKAFQKKVNILSRFVKELYVVTNTRIHKTEQKVNIFSYSTYDKSKLDNYFLVYDCTDNKQFTSTIIKDCQEKNILLNIHDKPNLCDFISPAIYQNKEIIVAVGSNAQNVKKSIMWRNIIKKELNNDKQ